MPQINEEFLNKLKKKKPELRPYDTPYTFNESKAVDSKPTPHPEHPVAVTTNVTRGESSRGNLPTDKTPPVKSSLVTKPLGTVSPVIVTEKNENRGKITGVKLPLDDSTPDKSPLGNSTGVESPRVETPLAKTTRGVSTGDNLITDKSPRGKAPPVDSPLDKSSLVKTTLDKELTGNASHYDSNFKIFSLLLDKFAQLNANEIRMLQIIKRRLMTSNEREAFISRAEFEKEGLQSKFITTIIKKLTDDGFISVTETKNKTNKIVKSYSILEFWK